MRKIPTAVAFAAILAGTAPLAIAQTNPSLERHAAVNTAITSGTVQTDQIRASKMLGSSVYDLQNRKIGSVKDLVLNTDGTAADAVIGTHQQVNASNRPPKAIGRRSFTPTASPFRALTAPVGFGPWWSLPAAVERGGYGLGKLRPPERLFEENQILQSTRPAFADIPRHHHDLEILPQAPGISRQVETADAVRHDGISQHHVYLLIGFQQFARRNSTGISGETELAAVGKRLDA